METKTTEQVMYRHHCYPCGKRWDDTKKVAECPRCGHPHIWFNETSFIVEKQGEQK